MQSRVGSPPPGQGAASRHSPWASTTPFFSTALCSPAGPHCVEASKGPKGPSEKRIEKNKPNKLDQPLKDREMVLSNLTRLGPEFVVPDMATERIEPCRCGACVSTAPISPARPGLPWLRVSGQSRKRKQGGGGVASPSRYTSKESKSQPRTTSPALGRRLLWDKTRWGRAIVGSGHPKKRQRSE